MFGPTSKLFKYLPWLVIPLFGLLYYSILFIMSSTTDHSDGFNWGAVGLICIQITILWYFANYRLKLSLKKNKRLTIWVFLTGILAVMLLNNGIYYGLRLILIPLFAPELVIFQETILVLNILEGLLKGFIIMSVLYSITYFSHWQKESLENEQLRSNELELENKALKSQLNPHFLFNNLNTLSSLIKTNPDNADVFLQEMSDMYRYILKINDLEVVSLKEEIDFAKNYNFLLEKRFGKNYECTIQIENYNYSLPPISLHLVLDNIVKHNRIDNQYPMRFSITQADDYLIVSNEINLKKNVDSTGKGLNLLQEQYKFLTHTKVEISEHDNLFTVKLPLLKRV
jgi:two-component system LytT family sensor kinase